MMSRPVLRAACASIPVATSGISGRRTGVACFCMFEPISARFASSWSTKGIMAGDNAGFSSAARLDRLIDDTEGGAELGRRMRDRLTLLFKRVKIDHLVGHLAPLDPDIRGFDNTVVVGTRVGCHAENKPDVLSFRRVDGAEAAVVREIG